MVVRLELLEEESGEILVLMGCGVGSNITVIDLGVPVYWKNQRIVKEQEEKEKKETKKQDSRRQDSRRQEEVERLEMYGRYSHQPHEEGPKS